MNKKERETLAQHCARMIYGISADRASQGNAQEILEDFPSIRDEFELWAEVYAADRIAGLLIRYWMNRKDSNWSYGGEANPTYPMYKAVYATKETIEDMLDVWADDNTPLTQLVDEGVSLDVIADSPGWRVLCERRRAAGVLPDAVFEVIN